MNDEANNVREKTNRLNEITRTTFDAGDPSDCPRYFFTFRHVDISTCLTARQSHRYPTFIVPTSTFRISFTLTPFPA